ncbi:hypothetical protein NC653_012069 [Populus alba x Populus x berolinensis]|uniref:Cytochrome P450 n=1 Tax=Populus alba x Populus x berolinensis TaxID=444605 RepID=A0AAD6R3U3_9ROSI|nr:hypothetical protein NC653_012069 [Populus alba x Populus x berolinensis]
MWYLDTFSKLINQEGESRTSAVGVIHKYIRSISLTHFGVETLKKGLLPEIEDMIKKTLQMWSTQESIEVKYGSAVDREKATKFLKDKLEERRNSPDMYRGDLLDQVTADLNKEDKEKFLSDDFIITVIFGLLFAGFESVSKILTLTLKLLAEHPSVLQELIAEHEGILKNRRNSDPVLTWDEYKSMTFTLQVINESLRLGNGAPGLLRRALKDIEFKGFTIPAGWIIMAVTSASHLNPDVYKDPLALNPARWKDMDAYLVFKNFMAFSGGTRQDHVAASAQVFVAGLLMAFLDLNFLITDGPDSREDELFELVLA